VERAFHAVADDRATVAEVSAEVFEVFRRFTPLVEGLSLDEAFLDATASQSLFGDGATIARAIKDAVRAETGLAASAGVAPCKFVAKVASDLGKPDGLLVVRAEEARAFLAPLPIERMWGVGPKTAPRLRSLGLHTLGDLAAAKLIDLEMLLGSWGAQVRALARAEDDREVDPNREAKSIGAEATYENDLFDPNEILRTLLEHAGRVAQRLVKEGLFARVVVVKLKYSDFTLRSRQATLPAPVADTVSLYEAARRLVSRFPPDKRGVRLTGISAGGLVDEPGERGLFIEPSEKRRKVEEVIANVSERFGGARLIRADLLDEPEAVSKPGLPSRG